MAMAISYFSTIRREVFERIIGYFANLKKRLRSRHGPFFRQTPKKIYRSKLKEMAQNKATAEVSDDGRSIICRSANGRVRWSRRAPSYTDWQRLAKRPVSVDLEAGIFQYVGDEHEAVIIAAFTPGLSLDFHLTYAAATGELIKISEAR